MWTVVLLFLGTALVRTEDTLRIRNTVELPNSVHLTGSDSPLNSRDSALYITAQNGALYRYLSEQRVLQLVANVHNLDFSDQRGLYNVAFDRNFQINSRMFLYYSATPPTGPEVDPFRQHDNVIAEYTFVGVGVQFVKELKRIPQFSTERSGGWLFLTQQFSISGRESVLFFSCGGNKEELIQRNIGSPELSTIYTISEFSPEAVWSSGIQNPLSCTGSTFKAGRVVCLIEDSTGQRHLFSLRKGYNYGSDEYVQACEGQSCAQAYVALASREAMLSFRTNDCPVDSVHMYTGYTMREYRMHLFLSQSACLRNGVMQPARVLRVFRDHSQSQFKTVVMATGDLLVNTTLLGADKHDLMLLFGHSLSTNRSQLSEIELK